MNTKRATTDTSPSEDELRLKRIVARRLREARRAVNLTQSEVAEKLGHWEGTWTSGLETARAWVTVPDLLRLSELYERPIDWLMGRDAMAFEGRSLGAWLLLFPGDVELAKVHHSLHEALLENREKLRAERTG